MADPALTLFYRFAQDKSLVPALVPAGVLGPTLDITRATAGTYFDANGVLQSAGSGVARFDHDPADSWASLGLLVEPASTNLARYSQTFDNGYWAVQGACSATPNTTVAPDGSTTADTITKTGAFAALAHWNLTISNATQYTFSMFVKAGASTKISIGLLNVGDHVVIFDLVAKTATPQGGSSIDAAGVIDVGGGWFRCWGTINSSGGTAARYYIYPDVNGSSSGSVICWGAQLEQGLLTSYVETPGGASATRNADAVGSTTVDWHNAAAGTFMVRGRFQSTPAAALKIMTVDDNSTADRFYLERDTDDEINFATINSGDNNGASDGGTGIAVDTEFIVAAAYADDDVRAAVDGDLSAADSAAGIPVGDTITNFRIGADSGGNYFNGHIAEVRYYNQRKLDAYLQDLSNGLVTESLASSLTQGIGMGLRIGL